jgi:thioredoxin reductase (NADPH)
MQGLSFGVSRASEASELENEYDVVILGGGPAGLTAAIYASRARAKTLLIEKGIIGGEAASTALIENYPGFPEGINGTELADRMSRQAERFGTKVIYATPTVADLKSWPFRIGLDEKTVVARVVIIASGTSPKTLNISGEKEFKGRGVSYCATCDGPIFTGKDITIIGAGNSGLQEGLFILKFVRSLTIVEYLPTIQAEEILQDRMTAHENVKWLLNHEIVAVNGNSWVTSISVKDRTTAEIKRIPVQGVFIYVGLVPNTAYLGGQVELNDWGYILTDQRMQTSLPGVFAAGDIRETEIRQVATAIGDGAVAAASAQHFLDNL